LGYRCIEGDLARDHDPNQPFDAVSLLNVLDRCDRPLSLLGAARSALEPGGLLVVALVLPYHPFVYDSGAARAPIERLPISSEEWELGAVEFVSLCLLPLGLEVVSLSRAPYLSGGDARAPLYELDDLIVVCRAVGDVPLVGN
jgi:SAM-dependent methyltransferase